MVAVDKLAPANPTTLALSQLLQDFAPLERPICVHGDALAAVFFTSGTEGVLKGLMLTHNNILASERAYCARLNLTWLDTILMPAPLGHATGFLHGVNTPFIIDARSVLLDIFNPTDCLELLQQERCTCVLGAGCDAVCLRSAVLRTAKTLRFIIAALFPVRRHHDPQKDHP